MPKLAPLSGKLVLFWLLTAAALAACRPSGAATPTAGNAAAAQPTVAAVDQSGRQPGCTVKTRQATPNPTLQSALPPPGEKDWVKGPADAYVTIIEYSDFQ